MKETIRASGGQQSVAPAAPKLAEIKIEPDFRPAAPSPVPVATSGYDVVKVCKAIAVAETSGCTDGTAIRRLNCHGIMRFWVENGVRHREPKYYSSHEESHRDCERIWDKYYGKLPDRALAVKWTGNDSPDNWMKNFYSAYNRL